MLPLNFRTLAYCGLWFDGKSRFVFLRRCWGVLIVATVFYFTFVGVIELYLLRKNVEELVDVMFLCVTYILLCLKILNFKLRHGGLLKLLEHFRLELCRATSSEEEVILQEYSKKASGIFQNILVLSQVTGVFFCILPFVTLNPADYVLPFQTHQFYDDTSTVGFLSTYFIQFVALTFGIFINVSMDTMVYGFIILATGQFTLISYRIAKSTKDNDKTLLRQSSIHHAHMKKTVREIQNVFVGAIAPLFFFSLLTLCASIFQMSQVLCFLIVISSSPLTRKKNGIGGGFIP